MASVYVYLYVYTIQFAMENPPMLLIAKPSISMGHLYHGYVK